MSLEFHSTPFFDMLTPDLITEILVRLPGKYILRCKSVSKPWLTLISNPNFTESHLKRTITTPGADQALFFTQGGSSASLLHLDSCEIGAQLGDFSFVNFFRTVGCCNGIVCFWYHPFFSGNEGSYCTYLWNPATKQAKRIPRQNMHCDDIRWVIMGFGFDPVSNDYKIVALLKSWAKTRTVEVYSANANVWRTVETDPNDFRSECRFDDFNVCVNGFLCCLRACGVESFDLLAFDLNKEVFTCGIKLPNKGYWPICTMDFNGSVVVAVTSSKERVLTNVFNLWKLDDEACLRDSGVEASWTLMLSINVGHPALCVFGYFNSRDLLLCTPEDHAWILYNSDKNEARNVPVSLDHNRTLKYSESLVSITGFRHVNFDGQSPGSGMSTSMLMKMITRKRH